MRARRSAPAKVAASAHNDVLAAAYTRATTELEDRLAEILEPILVAEAKSAAEAFRQKATDHLTASALRRADRLAVLRSGVSPRDLRSLVPLLVASGALEGVSSTSTMVCVKPRADEAEAIADPGGAPAEGLHVTLAVLVDLDESRVRDVVDALKAVGASHAPLTGKVGGYGEFRPPGCGILLPDVPGLVELRVAVTEALVEQDIAYARDHGYQPHITVDGQPEDGEIDAMLERTTGAPLHFDAILVVRGDQTVAEIPLVGPRPITASLTAAAPVDPADVAFRVAQFEKAVREMRAALAAGDAVAIAAARSELNDQKEKLQETLAGATPTWSAPAGDEVVNVQALAEKIRAKTEPVRQALIETTMSPALAKAGLSFDVTNPLTQKALASTGAKVTGISETTRGDVMKVVQSAWESGLSIDHTAQMLSLVMQADARTRARTIARTELVGAVNGGSLAATQLVASATGSKYLKSWMTAPGAPHPRHELYDGLDGQAVALDEKFDVGGAALDHPGDPDGDPGEVINCFPGETLVEIPALRAATRRWYDGDLVRLRLASGDALAGTPNHPVLRADGRWVPLREVVEGDNLVGARLAWDDAGAPDPERPPAAISEVYRLAEMAGDPERVRLSPPDLHGDGSDGEIDVVALDGKLLLDIEAASDEEVVEIGLALASGARARTSRGDGATAVFDGWGEHLAWSAAYGVSPASQEATILVVHPLHTQSVRGRPAAHREADLAQATQNGRPTYAEVLADGEDAIAALVALTQVVEIEIEPFHGYVYNLDSGRGWYTAGTLACRNCRCTMRYVEADGSEQAAGDDTPADASPPPEDLPTLDTLNPTGGLNVPYDPEARAVAPLGPNMTTLDKTMGVEPDAPVTIYRGAPANQSEIAAGDFVTTNEQLAKDYAGEGDVLSKEVPASHVLDDSTEPLGEEYIYRPPVAEQVGGETAASDGSYSADVGVTPFRAGEDDPVGFYESDKYGQFINDVHDSASSYGVTVDGLDRVTGVWQGDTEPSVSLRIHDGEKGVRAYSANLGNAYHQDGVLIFGDHAAGDVMATFQNQLPQDRLTEAMAKAGIDGGRFTAEGRLQVIGSGPDFVKQLDALAGDIGPYDASAGRFELLERDSGDYGKAIQAFGPPNSKAVRNTFDEPTMFGEQAAATAAPLTEDAAAKALDQAQASFGTSLADSNVSAVNSYLAKDYEGVNSALRSGAAVTPYQQRVVDGLDSTIAQAPALAQDTTFWRGITSPETAFGTADIESLVGKTITDPGFGSTTTARKVGVESARGGTVLKILAPAGTQGIWVPGLARSRNIGGEWGILEREFILPRGAQYQVVSAAGDEMTVRLLPKGGG